MKKLALILAMVCFVLVLGAAQEFKPSVAISGSATAKVGFNLDTSIFALNNSFSTDVTFTLIPEATAEKKGEGTYGYIQIKNFKVEADSDNATALALTEGEVYAKIISGPFFVQIMDNAATKALSVGGYSLDNLSDDNFITGTVFEGTDPKIAPAVAGGYLYIGYDSDMIDFTLKVQNNNNYCSDLETADSVWYVNPSAAVTVAGATIKAGAIFGTPSTFDPGIGASVSYSYKLNDKINIVPTVGFDMLLADTTAWAIGGGVFAKWGGVDSYQPYFLKAAASCNGSTFDLTGTDVDMQGGAGVGFDYTDEGFVNLVAQVVEQRGDSGLVPGLGAALSVEIADLTGKSGDMVMNVGGFANYKIDNITPYARFVYGKDVLRLGAGVEVAKIIPNTTVFADYNSFNLSGDNAVSGLLSGGVKISF